jgi:glycosyltransferase involved in cell wall biosynthesis
MKVSVVIITLNEEKNIERCILSVKSIADEILVVDSFSTDRTKELCYQNKVRFVQQSWLGYAEQKNYANSIARNEWIFSIDADEMLSDELAQSIKKVETGTEVNVVFSVNRLNNYCGKWILHSGWYPDNKVRLFNKNYVKWSGNFVHEVPDIPHDFKTILLKGDLLHFSYNSKDEHLRQTEKYAGLSALQSFDRGKKSSIIKLTIGPVWRFFRDYILKLGFLDGKAGFEICSISARATYLKYKKLAELYKTGFLD